jgi:hypothetical protein
MTTHKRTANYVVTHSAWLKAFYLAIWSVGRSSRSSRKMIRQSHILEENMCISISIHFRGQKANYVAKLRLLFYTHSRKHNKSKFWTPDTRTHSRHIKITVTTSHTPTSGIHRPITIIMSYHAHIITDHDESLHTSIPFLLFAFVLCVCDYVWPLRLLFERN